MKLIPFPETAEYSNTGWYCHFNCSLESDSCFPYGTWWKCKLKSGQPWRGGLNHELSSTCTLHRAQNPQLNSAFRPGRWPVLSLSFQGAEPWGGHAGIQGRGEKTSCLTVLPGELIEEQTHFNCVLWFANRDTYHIIAGDCMTSWVGEYYKETHRA